MIKFLKKYWTHILNIFLFLFLIIMFSCDSILWADEINFIGIMFIILELILVLAVWGEIIYYIVYVAKNKDIPNRWFKALLVYILCYWYIPCFKLKYIDKDNNYKKKNIIYVIVISILMFLSLYKIFGISLGTSIIDNYTTYISNDNVVEFSIPSNYEKYDNIGGFDLYFSKGIKVNLGVLLYDDWKDSDLSILNYQEEWLLGVENGLELIENDSINNDGKEINTLIYKNNSDAYMLSTISFDEKDDYVVFVIISLDANYYDKCEEEIEYILENINLNEDIV